MPHISRSNAKTLVLLKSKQIHTNQSLSWFGLCSQIHELIFALPILGSQIKYPPRWRWSEVTFQDSPPSLPTPHRHMASSHLWEARLTYRYKLDGIQESHIHTPPQHNSRQSQIMISCQILQMDILCSKLCSRFSGIWVLMELQQFASIKNQTKSYLNVGALARRNS